MLKLSTTLLKSIFHSTETLVNHEIHGQTFWLHEL